MERACDNLKYQEITKGKDDGKVNDGKSHIK